MWARLMSAQRQLRTCQTPDLPLDRIASGESLNGAVETIQADSPRLEIHLKSVPPPVRDTAANATAARIDAAAAVANMDAIIPAGRLLRRCQSWNGGTNHRGENYGAHRRRISAAP
jgi:hypothetical protein